jgi:hypothetical protein
MVEWIDALWTRLLAALKNPANDPWWQALHFSAGMMFPLFGAAFGGLYASIYAGSGHQVLVCVIAWALLATLAGGVGWVVPKEFIFDILVESATWQDGVRDAGSYWKGILLSWGIILLVVWVLGAN